MLDLVRHAIAFFGRPALPVATAIIVLTGWAWIVATHWYLQRAIDRLPGGWAEGDGDAIKRACDAFGLFFDRPTIGRFRCALREVRRAHADMARARGAN